MNKPVHRARFLRCAQLAALLFAALFLIPALRAQPTEQTVQSRFLFVFETSKEMKLRLEATEKALNTMLATSLRGELHAGDSMGVWTFGQNLQTSGYPLQGWNPDAAVTIASNLVEHVGQQHYAKTARYELLQPLLNRVVQNSERLTVLVFCDGEGKISGTPYDDAISQVFKEKLGEQKNAHQPFVIVFRSQLGQYVGCAMTLPPQQVNIPLFPPLPEPPPPPAPKPAIAPPRAPVVMGQPLIIIGKKPVASLPPPVTSPPPVVAPVAPGVPNNATVPPTNPIVAKIVGLTPTNPPPAPAENSSSGNNVFMLVGAGLLGAAIALVLVFWLRPRPKDASLITRSMNDPK
jgi:hypothetical protein